MSDFEGDCNIAVDVVATQPTSKSFHMIEDPTVVIARLIPINPNVKTNIIEISNFEISIGRNPECTIVFNQTEISGVHCKIFITQGQITIQDLSSNGTFVNAVLVGKNHFHGLKNGDVISLVTKRFQGEFASYIFQDQTILKAQPEEIMKFFEFQKQIGQGTFSVVKLALHKSTGKSYAIKIIDKQKFCREEKSQEQIKREIQILSKVSHPNIVAYKGLYESQKYLYIILEYAEGGELFEHILQSNLLENEVRALFKQLLDAVYYLHNHGIAHRDLKPENILLDDKGKIKLSDFGLARFLAEASMMTTLCGTPQYVAPEVIKIGMSESAEKDDNNSGDGPQENAQGYGYEVDMWSLGVCLYMMLTKELPFEETDRFALFKSISRGQYQFDGKNISADAKNLISRLLVTDPQSRISAKEALEHPWVVRQPETQKRLRVGSHDENTNGNRETISLAQNPNEEFKKRRLDTM